MSNHLWILLSAMLVNNFTLVMFLGLCSFLGVTQKISTALRLGIADTFVLLITSVSASILNRWVLGAAPYLRIIAFIVVIATCR
jgi:Na+-translocating ferredoxin:NAD+ oxidoreductase subunit A